MKLTSDNRDMNAEGGDGRTKTWKNGLSAWLCMGEADDKCAKDNCVSDATELICASELHGCFGCVI